MLDQIYNFFLTQLSNNEILAGGIGISLFAAILYKLRDVPSQLWELFKFHYTVQLTIFNEDEAFDWINHWMAELDYTDRCRRLKLSTFDEYDQYGIRTTEDDDKPEWDLAPGFGRHFILYKNTPTLISRQVEDEKSQSNRGKRRETFVIHTLGRSQKTIVSIIQEARTLMNTSDTIPVYLFKSDYWKRIANKSIRPLETIILPEDQKQRIIDDAVWFFSARQWYIDRGVPYRRGYLFSGPAGCGKSSLVLSLSGYFQRPIYIINLGSVFGDDRLFDAISSVPERAILLIEDIDACNAAFQRKKRGSKKDDDDDEYKPITTSALLNAIDGAIATDGRLLIMTTNYPERLDGALVRAGRVDLKESINPSGINEIIQLLLKFYPDTNKDVTSLEAELNIPNDISIPAADIQGILMNHVDSINDAISEIRYTYGTK